MVLSVLVTLVTNVFNSDLNYPWNVGSMQKFDDEAINKRFNELVQSYSLCDQCLGRLAAKIGHGFTNKKRGEIIRRKLDIKRGIDPDHCWLCEGLVLEIDHFVSLVEEKTSEFEFETFLIGTHIDEEILEKEETLQEITGSEIAETIKTDLSRNIGKKIEKNSDNIVDFHHPDIMMIIDTMFDIVHLQIKSLYVYGRYNKFQRGIPQTKWFCRSCKGKGCRNCEYTGKLFTTSVEQLIAEPLLATTGATDESFHGSGREDIDVRMLGSGRPFVIELKNPRKRSIDYRSILLQINDENENKVGVHNLRSADKKEIAALKEGHFSKVYQVQITGKRPFVKEKLKKVALSLRGKTIQQFTPTRVARRRALKTRERKIYDCNAKLIDETMAIFVIEAESGTYIKELVTGDDGKTQPNISDLLHDTCTVVALDVMEIKGDENKWLNDQKD